MIYFAEAQYLFLILLIPFLFLFYALSLRFKKRNIKKLGNPELLGTLMPNVSKSKGWWKISLLSLALLFFFIGLSRPQLGARVQERKSKGVEVMIALDVSNSMLAEDFSPNRLERAKLAISRLVDRLQGDRIGLIVFAGESFVQLPITTDYVSAKVFLNSINTGSVPIQGTALGEAITSCAKSFSTQSDGSRAIILITDGENHEDDPIAAAHAASDIGIRTYCIGVGSVEGKPIPYEGELMKDKDGEIVVTRLDEETLMQVADAGNGIYVRAGNNEFGLNPIIDNIKELDEKQFDSVVFEDFDEKYMYFFAIALFFLILEILIGESKPGKDLF